MKEMENKWGIVVSLPKPESWVKSVTKPNMKLVGQFVVDDNGRRYSYRTRALARHFAADMSRNNHYWTYTVKKIA